MNKSKRITKLVRNFKVLEKNMESSIKVNQKLLNVREYMKLI